MFWSGDPEPELKESLYHAQRPEGIAENCSYLELKTPGVSRAFAKAS
jgi:hypothetical protein